MSSRENKPSSTKSPGPQADRHHRDSHIRAEAFHAAVAAALGDRLIAEGDQVLGATARQALLLELGTTRRPDARHLENMLHDLRHGHPGIIDLRPLKRDGDGYGISISAILEPGTDEAALAADLQSSVERALREYERDFLSSPERRCLAACAVNPPLPLIS